MYLPRTFEETDTSVLCGFIAAHPLATFVSKGEHGLCADHIPMLIARSDDGGFLLQGHVARANPLWRNVGVISEVMAVFHDPGVYITPSWYASKAETQKVVPTWNYIAVHVYGSARAVDDPAWLRGFLGRLTDAKESNRPTPWHITDAPDDYIAAQLKAIVGIEIQVTRWLGKWKVSQNRQPHDVQGVIAGLRALCEPSAEQMAVEVSRRLRS